MLSKGQVPSLGAVKIKPDGSLDGLGELDKHEYPEAGIVLIAHLLGLLLVFIGESLMLHILLDVWPDLIVFDPRTSGECEI